MGNGVELSGRPLWTWLSLAGVILLVLFLLGLAFVTIGFSVVKGREPFGRTGWIAGAVALAGAALFAWQGVGYFTRVGRIIVEESGDWRLLSPLGRELLRLPAAEERTLRLWAESSAPDDGGSLDWMQGRLEGPKGRTWTLARSSAFDALLRLGYGPFWLSHANLGPAEEKQARETGARMLFLGEGEPGGLVLPPHAFTPAGKAAVRAWLDGKAR